MDSIPDVIEWDLLQEERKTIAKLSSYVAIKVSDFGSETYD